MIRRWLVLGLCLLCPALAQAGTFRTAEDLANADVINHPRGYTGIGGALMLEVCLDPAVVNADEVAPPLQLAIATWNQKQPTVGNVVTGAVPAGTLDFRSSVLRALGLCLGLDDPTDASLFTRALAGNNSVFDRDDGVDDVAASRDDQRGDDDSLMWYRLIDNDPFAVGPGPVDSTTFTRDEGIVPEGDAYPAAPARAVATLLGYTNTEAVMVDGLQAAETKRSLVWDDVATLRYAATGLDELASTGDDYGVSLVYIGQVASCDIRVTFDVSASPAVCIGSVAQIDGKSAPNHFRFNSSFIVMSDAVVWHYDAQGLLFIDGFESGDMGRWSGVSN